MMRLHGTCNCGHSWTTCLDNSGLSFNDWDGNSRSVRDICLISMKYETGGAGGVLEKESSVPVISAPHCRRAGTRTPIRANGCSIDTGRFVLTAVVASAKRGSRSIT